MKTVNARDLQKRKKMCRYVTTGSGCHHAPRQAGGSVGWRRRQGLGRCGASNLVNFLEADRAEAKGVYPFDERTTDPFKEAQEMSGFGLA